MHVMRVVWLWVCIVIAPVPAARSFFGVSSYLVLLAALAGQAIEEGKRGDARCDGRRHACPTEWPGV